MSSECKKVEKSLIDLTENTLPEVLKVEIDKHFQGCAKCASLVRQFSLSWKNFALRERMSPPASFWPGLIKKIQDAEIAKPVRYRIYAGLRNSLRPALFTVILLAGAFLGYHLGQIPEEVGDPASAGGAVEEYFEAFEDFPPGSGADFYLGLI